MKDLESGLRSLCAHTLVNEPMSRHSWWRIGGPADFFCEPADDEEAAGVLKFCAAEGLKYVVTGAGSNLLWLDEGFRGVVLKIGPKMSRLRVRGEELALQAGAWGPNVARLSWHYGLSGLEHLIGVPGCVGGLVHMNAGSLRQGIGDRITHVTALTPQGEMKVLTAQEACFGYRTSIFQKNGWVVMALRLRLTAGDKKLIRREMVRIAMERRAKFPLAWPNCGSVFSNSDALYQNFGPIGKVIEDLGFKGKRVGAMEVSTQHANFFINRGGATSSDALALISQVYEALKKHTGLDVHCEVRAITSDGRVVTADQLA